VDAGDESTKNVVVIGVAEDAVDGDINAPVIFRVVGDEAANALQA